VRDGQLTEDRRNLQINTTLGLTNYGFWSAIQRVRYSEGQPQQRTFGIAGRYRMTQWPVLFLPNFGI